MKQINSIEHSMESLNSKESKHDKLKLVIQEIQAYLKVRDEDILVGINRHLQALSVTIDLSIFDPHTNVASEFFVSLYELMGKIDPKSHTAWFCIDVLTNVCKNPTARKALITTYQFLPPLSRLLSDQQTVEKTVTLLRLLQDLSCGIKITWQIPQLPQLMTTLTKWVECKDEEIITLSLGVLVNICYTNLPAVYILSRHVDLKNFLKNCLALEGPVIEIHSCKLLIILDHMNGAVPKSSLLKLVDATFKSILEAYKNKDAVLLRQIVEFYLDVKKHQSYAETLRNYPGYVNQVRKMLDIIEVNLPAEPNMFETPYCNQDPDCMALIFQFIYSLLNENLVPFNGFKKRLILLALKWLQADIVSSAAFGLLTVLVMNTEEKDTNSLEPLISGMALILLNLTGDKKKKKTETHIEHNMMLGSLLQLLRALMQLEATRGKVLDELKEEMLLNLFDPLLGNRLNDSDVSSTEAVDVYVLAVALVNDLAKYSPHWVKLLCDLMENSQILMILAKALYGSCHEIKKLILEMAAFNNFPHSKIAEAMVALQSTSLIEPLTVKKSEPNLNISFPLFSFAQIERLDDTLSRLKTVISEKNGDDLATSEVMELYEYKLASMGHAERAALASVEAASERCTHLQHRNAQITAELNRLHQLLFHTQQCQEQAIKFKSEMVEVNKRLLKELETVKASFQEHSLQLQAKEKALNDCRQSLEDTRKKLESFIKIRYGLEEENSQLKQLLNKEEERSSILDNKLQKMGEDMKKAEGDIENYKYQLQHAEAAVKQKDSQLKAKSEEISQITKELRSRKQIIDTITKVANSQMF